MQTHNIIHLFLSVLHYLAQILQFVEIYTPQNTVIALNCEIPTHSFLSQRVFITFVKPHKSLTLLCVLM